ncbi:MAG TPA: long-chain fatty acid--CoA ligase [Candidatus Bathyarchaeia archaeon]|nr:long-chain fatty acid--CoA ligase [Candidatus Bathyarchaeia archaeon]
MTETHIEPKPWHKNWPQNVPKTIQYPLTPLHELLEMSAEKHPTHPAIHYMGKTLTYQELNESVDHFAAALAKLGVKQGDRVAIYLPNIPQFIISFYAASKIGAINTAVSPLYRERELEYQINDSGAETLIYLDLLHPIVDKIRAKTKLKNLITATIGEYLPSAKRILGGLLGKVPKHKIPQDAGVHQFKPLLESVLPDPPDVQIDPKEDLVALQYTGGTTGTPKGAMLTHYNLVTNAVACAYWLHGTNAPNMETKDVFLTAIPLFHIYGMTTAMNAPIYLAGTMVLLPKPEPVDILKAIQNQKVTVYCGVPTLYSMLIEHPDIRRYNLKTIKFCISGSAPLPPEIQKIFMDLTGGVLVEGYGLTESSPVTHCNPLDQTLKTVKIGTIGLPWPDTDAKIVDTQTGTKELSTGEDGELIITGPQIMKGYWNLPQETKDILRQGWLYTGDIAHMDPDGYFHITDRKKDLIKYKGYSVYPREIEDILYEHPAIKLCAVIGKPDKTAGEIPKAYIVLKEGNTTATEEEIKKFVNAKVAPYKAIRQIEFRTQLPMTPVGKVLRRSLRQEEKEKKEKPSKKPKKAS